jgi:ribosomal protein S18 acetylase RimI-like enzyme
VDERFIQLCCDEEMSIGDFVLTGGEIPAMAIADSVCRMVPGVLSDPECYIGESHWDGLLEYPQYTRPDVWEGMEVPEVLRAGNHADVAVWRREQQLIRTKEKRPDMFEAYVPQTEAEKAVVERLTGREKLRFDCHRAELQDMADLLLIADETNAFLLSRQVDMGQYDLPSPGVFRRDITAGNCWLFTFEGEAAGCMTVSMQDEPEYGTIHGAWLTNGTPYGTLHRIAVRSFFRGRGLAGEMLQLAEDLSAGRGMVSVRIDIPADNTGMRRILEARGYTRCGILHLETGAERVGYEKLLV